MKDKLHYILVGLAIVLIVFSFFNKKSGFENNPLVVEVYSDYTPGKNKAFIKSDYIVKENQEVTPKYQVKIDNSVIYFKDSGGNPINQEEMRRLTDVYSHCYQSTVYPNVKYCIKDKI